MTYDKMFCYKFVDGSFGIFDDTFLIILYQRKYSFSRKSRLNKTKYFIGREAFQAAGSFSSKIQHNNEQKKCQYLNRLVLNDYVLCKPPGQRCASLQSALIEILRRPCGIFAVMKCCLFVEIFPLFLWPQWPRPRQETGQKKSNRSHRAQAGPRYLTTFYHQLQTFLQKLPDLQIIQTGE